MRQRELYVAFYGEGNTEYDFLQKVVERTLQEHEIIWNNGIIIKMRSLEDQIGRSNTVWNAAQKAHHKNVDFIIYHLDADGRNIEDALEERFNRPYDEVLQTCENSDEELNPNFVPIVPIKSTDAWMLADFETFQNITRINKNAKELGFPFKPRLVEGIQNPKFVVEEAIKSMTPGRRRRKARPVGDIHTPLGERIKLERLRQIPSYQDFVQRLDEMLDHLRVYSW